MYKDAQSLTYHTDPASKTPIAYHPSNRAYADPMTSVAFIGTNHAKYQLIHLRVVESLQSQRCAHKELVDYVQVLTAG